MKYLSVCSGIEAASVAWHQLGWKPLAFSEIEPFPRAVLAHHYADVPCHGDFTKLRDEAWIVNADVLVGGTPCQAFSVAGLRNSLADDRGNLSLEFVRLADAIDDFRHDAGKPGAIIVWENVPGVLSVKDNAFGCFLAALAGEDSPLIPTGGRWTDFGVVIGPRRRIAWRVLDAQYFGLAQRRRRVFVVASSRDGCDPVQILSQPDGVQRHSPPRRETGKGLAHPTAPCLTSSGRGVERTGDTRGQDPIVAVAVSLRGREGGGTAELGDEVQNCLRASSGGGDKPHVLAPVAVPIQEVGKRTGVSTDDPRAGIGIGQDGDPMFTLQAGAQHGVAAYAFQPRIARNGRGDTGDIVNALNAQSGGTGKGDAAPCVAVINHGDSDASTQEINAIATLRALRDAVGEEAFAQWRFGILDTLQSPEVLRAFVYGRGVRRAAREAGRWLDDGALSRPQDLPTGALLTLWEDGPDGRSPQGRELAQQLARQLGQALPVLPHQDTPTMAVRRLTPKEAERLQGFPDNYTAIPWRGKPADQCPDGPRYKALGNSMAVPCMRWIGQRIAAEIATAAKTNSEEKAA